MIPADLTARLRLLTEATFFSKEPKEVGALKNAQPISQDLPDFLPGDRILATLREAKSANTFRALIDGREYTLTLPRNTARSGQTLDLVVTQASPKAVIATVAEPGTAAVATNLSQTGRMISFLLTGQPAPPPAPLASGQPLLQTPPQSAAQITPVLRQAISESGLFYESHLARWLSGAVSTESLLKQPQSLMTRGRFAMPLPATTTATTTTGITGAPTPSTAPTPMALPASPTSTPPGTPSPAQAAPGGAPVLTADPEAEELQAAGQSAAAQRQPGQSPSQAIPERLMPIVHQQLDALATNLYAWHGTVWPGQQMTLEIEQPEEREGDGSEEQDGAWKTTLRLTMPRLGGIEARLRLSPDGIAFDLRASDPATANALEAGRPDLQEALAAADLTLTHLRVEVAASPESAP